jgi:CheY-like chemotaxis protein
VDSQPGGTRFRVLFPPLDAATAIAGEALPGHAAARELPKLSGRVLVVDDDAVAGGFMADLLETWGLTPTVLNDSPVALQRFMADPRGFDLAVLDQTMPHMKGLELARRMSELRPDLPVILYTGYSEGLDPKEVKAAGVRELIRKPVDTDELLELLRKLLTPAH